MNILGEVRAEGMGAHTRRMRDELMSIEEHSVCTSHDGMPNHTPTHHYDGKPIVHALMHCLTVSLTKSIPL